VGGGGGGVGGEGGGVGGEGGGGGGGRYSKSPIGNVPVDSHGTGLSIMKAIPQSKHPYSPQMNLKLERDVWRAAKLRSFRTSTPTRTVVDLALRTHLKLELAELAQEREVRPTK
jgi:hypothetical protein